MEAAAEAGEASPRLAEPWGASGKLGVLLWLLQSRVCVVVRANMHVCWSLFPLHCCEWTDQWDHSEGVQAPAQHSPPAPVSINKCTSGF